MLGAGSQLVCRIPCLSPAGTQLQRPQWHLPGPVRGSLGLEQVSQGRRVGAVPPALHLFSCKPIPWSRILCCAARPAPGSIFI